VLVDDVLFQIASSLSPRDILVLALVSRRYNEFATPLIYAEIRLIANPNRLTQYNDKQCLSKRQNRFRAALAAHPELALHIRTLSWFLDTFDTIPDFIIFAAPMKNLQTLHVMKPYGTSIARFTAGTPSVFLPACTRVVIEGLTNLEFAQHVIHPNQLEELSFESDIKPTVDILTWVANTPFPHLTKLCLRAPGGKSLEHEIELLQAWKQVIFSLQTVLEEVTLGLRMTQDYDNSYTTAYWRAQPSTRELVQIIWPVFLQGNFPRLRTLTLTGVEVGDGASFLIPPQDMLEIESVVPSVILASETPPSDSLWSDVLMKRNMMSRYRSRVVRT
jgi:F-box-like